MASTVEVTGSKASISKATEPIKFALIGAAGYIAPRHLKAIRDTGNDLVAALDPHDSVGILDSFFPAARFFTEIERFDRFLEKSRRDPSARPIEYVSICSPNYLHDAHVRQALRVRAHAICEKPLVINPWNLDQLADLELEYGRRIFTVLQLRLHPEVKRLREEIKAENGNTRHDIELTYVSRRGQWYHSAWKGSIEQSGGLAMNIGIHFFDLLLWIFGRVERSQVHLNNPTRMAGVLELEWASVRWFLSIDESDLPADVRSRGGFAHRSMTVDGNEVDLSTGFTDLHTRVYEHLLRGEGFGLEDARQAIELIYAIRNSREVAANGFAHPLLSRGVR